jgi:SpoIIAA-like
MIKSELLKEKGVLIVSPVGPLGASDFEHLAGEIDPYIEQNGRLHGLMIYTETFPGWKDFAALLCHLKFVRDHQLKIEKVAAVSDSSFLGIMPSVVGHFVKAQVKHFNYDDKDKALEWLAPR